MGSPCEIRVYAKNAMDAANAIKYAIEDINRLENKYSRYIPGNFCAQLNKASAAGSSIAIDAETASLLDFADTCYQQSEGLFDISSGVLRQAWDFSSNATPDPKKLEQLKNCIGWTKIKHSKTQVSFLQANMELDFGGIVKEYAADRAKQILQEQGLRHGLVDLGGDIAVMGPAPNGEPWRIKIRHPREQDQILGSFEIAQGGLASSGDYERQIEVNGQRYSHLLNPNTGWPVQGMAAVSISAAQCLLAGASCTIAMLKGQAGIKWLADLGLPYLCMDTDGNVSKYESEEIRIL